MKNSNLIFNEFDNVILIRYSEIALKSDQVRKRLIEKLIKNIKIQISNEDLKYKTVFKDRGRIYLKVEKKDMGEIIDILKHVFGVYSVSPAFETTKDFDSIMESVGKYGKSVLKLNNTFGLRTRKIGKKEYSSNDLAVKGGAIIIETLGEKLNLKVNLTNPDVWIYVEARDKASYIYSQKIMSYWQGNPIEYTRGGLAIINGRLSEFVSLFRGIKRGMYVLPILFNDWSEEKENAVKKTILKIKKYLPIRAFYYINFDMKTCSEEINSKIKTNGVKIPYILIEKIIQMKIIEWFMEHQVTIFEIFEGVDLLNQKSNVAVSMDKNRAAKLGRKNRREFVEYNVILGGNLSESTFCSDCDVFHKIESSKYPIFRAAIALYDEEIVENYLNIDQDLKEFISILNDQNKDSTNGDEIVDIAMVKSAYSLSEVILKDMGLSESPNEKNLKFFSLEESE